MTLFKTYVIIIIYTVNLPKQHSHMGPSWGPYGMLLWFTTSDSPLHISHGTT